jgi:membrane protease YdiL (CAAX protease family)
MRHPAFPNILQAVFIIISLMLLEVLIGIVMYDLGYRFQSGDPGASGVIALSATGVIVSLILAFQKMSYKELFHNAASSATGMLIVLGLPLLITSVGVYIVLTELESLIVYLQPMPNEQIEMFQRLFGGGMISLITLGIIAPLMEEMLFRGIFLRGFLHQYSMPNAILYSAILFAGAHLNIYQIPSAFLYGCLLGWIYVKTRSLWPGIVCHGMINITAYIDYHAFTEPESFTSVEFVPLPVLLLGTALMAGGIIATNRLLTRRPS